MVTLATGLQVATSSPANRTELAGSDDSAEGVRKNQTWARRYTYVQQNLHRAVREPRVVLAEFGTVLDENVRIRVHDSTADMRYLVLPMRPAETEGMSEAALAELVTRDTLIGVTLPQAPALGDE